MELTFWWLLPMAAAAAAGAGWLVFRKRAGENARRRPVANADRLTSLPQRQEMEEMVHELLPRLEAVEARAEAEGKA